MNDTELYRDIRPPFSKL